MKLKPRTKVIDGELVGFVDTDEDPGSDFLDELEMVLGKFGLHLGVPELEYYSEQNSNMYSFYISKRKLKKAALKELYGYGEEE